MKSGAYGQHFTLQQRSILPSVPQAQQGATGYSPNTGQQQQQQWMALDLTHTTAVHCR